MSFSLYGALPPSKRGTESEKNDSSSKKTTGTGGTDIYSSLPSPGTSTLASNDTGATTTAAVNMSALPTTVKPAQPSGWSAFNKFRPVLRRPTIQAKPKLNKPYVPAGATIVSTKTVTKEEREVEQKRLEQEAAQKSLEKHKAQETMDNIDLGSIPLLTSADDVNGFKATQKSKKKAKKGKQNANNTQPLPVIFNMLEDYDPHKPNDYEQYKEERRELREQQRKKREWEKRQQGSRSGSRSRSRSRSPSQSRSRSRSPYYSRSPSPEGSYRDVRSPTFSNEPPKINVNESADEAYRRRMMMSQNIPDAAAPPPPKSSDTNPAHEIAQKILAKYGWQEGQELGDSKANANRDPIYQKATQRAVENERVSPVILLTNMVGPGEVDDLLPGETADECSKYGKVERCLIFEVPNGKIQDDLAVRIFVKFSEVEAARRAINDLNGRFFDGRVVAASFFDSARFDRLDLAPTPQEFHCS